MKKEPGRLTKNSFCGMYASISSALKKGKACIPILGNGSPLRAGFFCSFGVIALLLRRKGGKNGVYVGGREIYVRITKNDSRAIRA